MAFLVRADGDAGVTAVEVPLRSWNGGLVSLLYFKMDFRARASCAGLNMVPNPVAVDKLMVQSWLMKQPGP